MTTIKQFQWRKNIQHNKKGVNFVVRIQNMVFDPWTKRLFLFQLILSLQVDASHIFYAIHFTWQHILYFYPNYRWYFIILWYLLSSPYSRIRNSGKIDSEKSEWITKKIQFDLKYNQRDWFHFFFVVKSEKTVILLA